MKCDPEKELAQLRAEVEREKERAEKAEARMSVIDAANRSPDPCAWERLKDAAVRATSERDQLRAEVEREKARADKATAERDRLAASLTRIADRCAAEDSHDMSREERREAMRTIRDDARTALAGIGGGK